MGRRGFRGCGRAARRRGGGRLLALGLWTAAALAPAAAPLRADAVSSLLSEADRLLLPWAGEGTYDTADRQRLTDQTERALAKVQEADRQAPEDARVKHRLGVCLSLLTRYEEAEAAFARAEERAASDFLPIVLQDRGLCAMRQRQYDRALEFFQRVLAIRPWQPDTRYHMGLIYERRGLTDRALELYSEELNHNMRNGKAWQAYFRLKGVSDQAGGPAGRRQMQTAVILLGAWVVVLMAAGVYLWRRRRREPGEVPEGGGPA